MVLLMVSALGTVVIAEQRGRGGRGGRGGGQERVLTPEQQAARDEAQTRNARPMDALDSVWLEELTVPEVADAINGGRRPRLS